MSREKLIKKESLPYYEANRSQIPVVFFKLGGTWDMIIRDGRRIGTGNFDDDELRKVQDRFGLLSTTDEKIRNNANRELTLEIYRRFLNTQPEPIDCALHLQSWATSTDNEKLADLIKGPFIPLFSGDSSHLRNPLIAPMVLILLETAMKNPDKPILGGQGTDTADIALICLYDVFVYDTQLPPLILTGANHPHMVPGSDAPDNFVDAARITHLDLGAGAFWVFHKNLYQAADVIKADPEESRQIEGQGTFFAPHRRIQSLTTLLTFGRRASWENCHTPPEEHILHRLTLESFYDALESVYVIDLGNQNPSWSDMEKIQNPCFKAIVVATHGLGNVDNETRMDLIRAALKGKIVVDTSRSLIGRVDDGSYGASLITANHNDQELGGSGKIIINAHNLNKTTARALSTRAVLAGLSQQQTQELFDDYATSRKMI